METLIILAILAVAIAVGYVVSFIPIWWLRIPIALVLAAVPGVIAGEIFAARRRRAKDAEELVLEEVAQ